ncbi:Sphingosine N-acyltransferase lag1 [Spiromyces aspiralis]|uniref:Sphingosine N-acyltransferase lag1 n=1 Tax=Spiromyces aspiralis TaxID=68401 RepID=A0ACC1HBA8_9FUNG|nr:Sphingosine N-acyltransferase lag1 [Spiromyces aspiralis]
MALSDEIKLEPSLRGSDAVSGSPPRQPKKQLAVPGLVAKYEFLVTSCILSIVLIAHYILKQAWAAPFVNIHYQVGTDKYIRGRDDLYFVLYWLVKLSFLRSLLMKYVFPVIAQWAGVSPTSRKCLRICEVGWMFTYYITMWCIGFKIMYNSPYWLNTTNLYAGYPEDHMVMPYNLKWFYLVQLAFWFENLYIIHVEERRKDHYEMLTHHFVTISLVIASYHTYFTRWGHVFMLIMDAPDIFLTLAKLLRYLGFNRICNYIFGLFAVCWFITKHYFCFVMMLSIWTQAEILIPEEKRYPNHPNSYATYPLMYGFLGVLCVLQAILLIWMWMLLKIIIKAITEQRVEDTRSDTEELDETTPEPNVHESCPPPIAKKAPPVVSFVYLSLAVCVFGVIFHYYPQLVYSVYSA